MDYNILWHYHEIKIFLENQTLVNSRMGSYVINKDKISKVEAEYPDKKNRKKLIQNFIDTIKIKNIIILRLFR